MIKDIGDFPATQPDVYADQCGSDQRHRVMGFKQRRGVGTDKGDLVPLFDPRLLQSAGELVDALIKLLIAVSLVIIDDRSFFRINQYTALQKIDWCFHFVIY